MNDSLWPIVGILFFLTVTLTKGSFNFRNSFWFYAVFATSVLCFWPYSALTNAPMWLKYELRASHAQSLFYLMLPALIFDPFWPGKKVLKFLGWFFAADALAILGGFHGVTRGLSFDSAFIALLIPVFICTDLFSFKKFANLMAIMVCLAAIFKVGGATAYFILAFEVIGACLTLRSWKYLVFLLPLVAAGWFTQGYDLILSPGRLKMWGAFFDYYRLNSENFIGMGLGSFEWLGSLIYSEPVKDGRHMVYTFAHNDFLQVLFELGIIGFVLFLGVIGEALYNLYQHHKFINPFMMAMGFLPFMFFYSPLHIFPGLLIGILLIKESRRVVLRIPS